MSSSFAKVQALRPSARKAALLVLAETEKGMPLQSAVSRALDSMVLSPEARRQATDLAYWCLRAQVRCQFVLSRIFPKFDRFAAPVRHLLLAACTALLFQEGAPAYAVVNETVEDIRSLAGKSVAGAANGVLRSLLRLGDAVKHRDYYRLDGEDDFTAFCRYTSFPLALGRLLVKECGEEKAEAVMQQSFARPVPCVRLNVKKAGWEELKAELVRKGAEPLEAGISSCGLSFPNGIPADVSLAALAREGKATLQAAGSQLALGALHLDKDAPLWDACCGFGGKTTALLEAGYRVELASDLSWQRISCLSGECSRLGLKAPASLLCDGAHAPFMRWDGTILLDVPCSGLGVLARRPDIKMRKRDVAQYVKTQRALLERAVLMAPKGRDVVYMTCTVTKSENKSLVRNVCQSYDAEIAEEWASDAPYEGMYACRIRV